MSWFGGSMSLSRIFQSYQDDILPVLSVCIVLSVTDNFPIYEGRFLCS